MLKPKYKLSGRPLTFRLLHIACQGGQFAPPTPSVTPLAMIYCICTQ